MALFGQNKTEDVAALISKKNYSKAIEVIKTQIKGGGRPDPRLRNQLADVLIMAGRERDAVPILFSLADEHAREGFAAKAVAVLKKIQKIDPGRRDVDARLAVLIQKKQEQATVSLTPSPSGGFEIGMEEIGFEPPPGGGVSLPMEPEPEAAEVEAEVMPELEPEPEPVPRPPPRPAPAARPRPSAPPPAPKPRPPAAAVPVRPPRPSPPAPVVDRDLLLEESEAEPALLDEAEPLTLESEPFVLELEPAAAKPAPRPAPPPAKPAARPKPVMPAAPKPAPPKPAPVARRPTPRPPAPVAPQPIEPGPLDLEAQAEPEPVIEPEAEPEILLEPEAVSSGDPMSDTAFAEELLAVIENVFPTSEQAAFSPEAAEPAAEGAQIVVSPLFKDFSVDEMVAVIQGLTLQTYDAGGIIITEGEPGNSLYMLTSGQVKAFKKNAQGKQVLLGELDEGAFFGEVSVLTGKPRTATIVASTNCELLELDRATLDNITKNHPHVRQVLREFAQQRLQKRS